MPPCVTDLPVAKQDKGETFTKVYDISSHLVCPTQCHSSQLDGCHKHCDFVMACSAWAGKPMHRTGDAAKTTVTRNRVFHPSRITLSGSLKEEHQRSATHHAGLKNRASMASCIALQIPSFNVRGQLADMLVHRYGLSTRRLFLLDNLRVSLLAPGLRMVDICEVSLCSDHELHDFTDIVSFEAAAVDSGCRKSIFYGRYTHWNRWSVFKQLR
nr:hypothetical protein CFP56_70560 [Quercus suber]